MLYYQHQNCDDSERNMSLYQLTDYPKYVVCTTNKKLYSMATGKLIEMVPETKSTRSFSLNTVVNGKRKKVFMTFDKIVGMDKKPYGSDISEADIKKTIRQGDVIESRYQLLPKPYHNYVYDTFEKELYSLHRSKLNVMQNTGTPTNKRWLASLGINNECRNVTTLMINAWISAGLTKDFKYNPLTDVYWIVVNICVGTVLPLRFGNAVDAGEVAKEETLNTGIPHHIFKLSGKVEIDDKDKIKVVKMAG